MAGRTPSEALDNFLVPLRRAVACVSRGQIRHSGAAPEEDQPLLLEEMLPGGAGMRLSILQTYRVMKTDDPDCKVHFPTGRISVEDFLWALIDGFDVPTRRDDWQDVLHEGRTAFEDWRTWT